VQKPSQPDVDGNLLYRRAVSCKAKCGQVLTVPGLPTHKQEFCSLSLQPSRRCKTHASLPARTPTSIQFHHDTKTTARLPRLCHIDNLIKTCQIHSFFSGLCLIDILIMILKVLLFNQYFAPQTTLFWTKIS